MRRVAFTVSCPRSSSRPATSGGEKEATEDKNPVSRSQPIRRVTAVGIGTLGLSLLLSGCSGSGFGNFLGNTFSLNGDPNQPVTPAENVQRSNGATVSSAPVTTQAGNVWPGPIKPLPSLADIAKTLPEAQGVPTLPPVPASPVEPVAPTYPSPTAPTPPIAIPPRAGPPEATLPSTSEYQPSVKVGTIIETSHGPEKVSGGTGNFLTLTAPGGQYGGIMVPNGNGTSTIIRPDGTVETVKTPH